ncbi:MAG: hypothetical protein JW927_00420 [Deltaproteobacteria bacterium]|nr:hypothetical protein [Deltaproteobacteria bacterium]
MKLRGRVSKKVLYTGTKSEHEAIILTTRQGEFKLRRKGGNAFMDDTLINLEGKEIEGDGVVRENQFIMDKWIII